MIFIDWLTIRQEHVLGELPLIGKDVKVSYDLQTGQKNYEILTGIQHEGSHSTSLRVRCDGRMVEVSGNPSAFSRSDNLYGYTEITDCIELYNQVLNTLGLPNFIDSGRPATFKYNQSSHDSSVIALHEPEITRVDLTENLATPNALTYLRSISSYTHHGKCGHLYPDGLTADWNGKYNGGNDTASTRVYIKYYVKEYDIQKKITKIAKLSNQTTDNNQIEQLQTTSQHLSNIRQYCQDQAIVRHEVTFKAQHLKQHGMNRIYNWNNETMNNIIRPYQFHNRLRVEQSDIQNTITQLTEQGVSLRVAHQADILFNAWLQGKSLHFKDGGLKRDTFYRMRKVLLLVGVDIAQPCQIAHLPLQSIKMTAKPVQPPEWYVMPETKKPNLRLVA